MAAAPIFPNKELTLDQEQAIFARVDQETAIFREGMLHLLAGRNRDFTEEEGQQFDDEAHALMGRLKAVIEEQCAKDGQLKTMIPAAATSAITITLMAFLIAHCREIGGLPEEVDGLVVRMRRT